MSGIVGTSDSKSKVIGRSIDTAHAWVNFNGTSTVAIRDSFGVSSVTDNGTGKYSVNLSTAISADGSWSDANQNGVCVGTAQNDASLCSVASCRFTSETAILCLSSNYSTYIYASLYDNTQIFVVAFGQ